MAYSKQNFQDGQILTAANLEKMENGIIAGQGAENLLDNSNFRDPVNSRGKNTYSDAGNEYTIDRWKTQNNTNISIENGYINIIGQWELYQIIQNPKDGIYTFAARIRINSVGQFTPIMEVNNGSNTGRQISLDADIGEWKTYILQYDLSSMTAETIKFLLSPRGGNTTASISVEWAAMYKGAYTANILPAYVPKGKHVEMLNCGVSLQPHNLLDNSDFRNPVNSRGITSTEASGYHIDRWKKENSSGKVTVGNGYLSMTGTGAYWFLTQYIEPKKIKSGAVYTIALADTSGSISICSTVMSTNMTKFTARHTFTSGAVVITNVEYASDKYSIYFTSNSSKETRFAWAVLYEGFYTADTIPPYVPKGKHVEMLNCGVSLAPHNLLDNSDFINAINQGGKTSWTSHGVYCIDRWKTESANNAASISYTAGSGITLTPSSTNYAGIIQQFENYSSMTGKVYTIAVCVNNVWYSGIFTMGATPSGGVVLSNGIRIYSASGYNVLIRNPAGQSAITIQRVALYEGSYTTDILPPYVSKGKHVEMLNCGVPLAPQNLLDNSDFSNPVNQRGQSSYSGAVYGIDRWKGYSTQQTVSVRSIDTTVSATGTSYIGITQKVKNMSKLAGKTITFAAKVKSSVIPCIRFTDAERISLKNVDGTAQADQTLVLTYTVPSNATSDSVIPTILCRSTASGDYIRIYWAALYEGSYDASTLPAYQPKGYAVELAECMRYYENSWFGVGKTATQEYIANVWSSAQADARIEFKQQKRISPTITFYPIGTESNWKIFNNGYKFVDSVENKGRGGLSGFIARVSKGSSDDTTWTIGNTIQAQGHWEASADL